MPSETQPTARVTGRLGAWARGLRWSAIESVAAVWFVLTIALVLWSEGLGPRVFLTPDETTNRLAARLISETGHAFLKLPFADPENLAHPRPWITRGDVALPIYPPVTLYFYAFLSWLGPFGEVLLVLLPASGAAAFAAGVARLLPSGRRFLALLAPALGMPALYWFSRPWMNMCALLTCLGWAVHCFSLWRVERRAGFLGACMLCVGAGAAARPDSTAYLLLVALVLAWGAEPSAWRRVLVLTFAAGAFALVTNLVGNYLVTGNPVRAAYQLVVDAGDPAPALNPLLKLLKLLFFPLKFPGWAVIGRELVRYWILLQPTWILLGAQLSFVCLLARMPRTERIAVCVAVGLVLVFMVSRIETELFGVGRSEGWVHDSIPRYFAPVYLLAALPPLLVLGNTKRRWLLLTGSLALSVLAAGNFKEVVWRSPQSVARHHELAKQEEGWLVKLARLIPADAMVYTPTWDKVLGSTYRVGSLDEDDPEPGAKSMERAVASSLHVYYWTHRDNPKTMRPLERALSLHHLTLVRVDKGLRLYRVEAAPPAESP